MKDAKTENAVDSLDDLDDFFEVLQSEEVGAKEAKSAKVETQNLDLSELDAEIAEDDAAADPEDSIQILKSEKSEKDEDKEEEEEIIVEDKPVEVKVKKSKVAKRLSPSYSSAHSLVDFGKSVLLGSELVLVSDETSTTEDNLQLFEDVKAVKVREKLANMLSWYAGTKTLSRYTATTLKLLIDKGEVTKADLRNNLMDIVKPSTASSQAGQMSHILKATKVAIEKSGKFVANEDSVMLALMKESLKVEVEPTPATT
jgi:hypothetical protein